jgi:hypothetical protein
MYLIHVGQFRQGHSAKNQESGIFGTHFQKMLILRFHDLIAKIHPDRDPDFSDPDFSDPNFSDSHTLLTQ